MIIDYLLIWMRVRETRLSAKFTQEMLAETICDKHGFHVLDHVLRLLIGTWDGEPNSLSANMLNSVARLVAAYGDQIKDTIFKERLSRLSIKTLSQTAKDRRVGSLGYAEAILIFYNKRSKVHLTWDRLYTKKPTSKNIVEDLLTYVQNEENKILENSNEKDDTE